MGTALEKYKARLAKKGQDYAGEEKSESSFITTRGGILKFGEEELPGNEMLVVVVDAIHENAYYPGRFDPEQIVPPTCFALGRIEKDLEPHENVLDPSDPEAEDSYFELQSEFCSDCPQAEWGSADTGRGKACTNRRRLAVIPAGRFTEAKKGKETDMEVFDDPKHFKSAGVAFLKLPVTSTKNWAKYVHMLNKEHQVPPFGALTHIYLVPDTKTQFKICFDLVEIVSDPDIIDVLFERNEEAKKLIEQPYNEPSEEEMEEPKTKARTGLKGLRKKRRS